ncbi:MAG: type II toxin-antitoxin system mRNA interferase toxin, RelE/StbE family [Candidatus Pacearchaeota archaeon]|jgi:mRNA interferase RelE/StbE/toxin YoeB
MAYKLEIPENLDKIFHKLFKKDKNLLEIINNKIIRILENPYQFKPLRNEMAGIRRVHIGKSFVLTYDILEGDKIVRLLDYDHHDSIYKP